MIYITGDTHGDIDFHKFNSHHFPEGKKLTKNDYVIICGDFGSVWGEKNYDAYMQKWYTDKPWTTLFVDGNHENHDLLDSYPVKEWNGGKVHFITPSVIHLMRGQIYTIEGKTFFTMGGAVSTDKEFRKEGREWWARETPSSQEYAEGLLNLEKIGNKVDYVLTHCAPDYFQDQIAYWYEHDKVTNYLEIVRQTINFEHWFCGHYHIDKTFEEKFHALYDTKIVI